MTLCAKWTLGFKSTVEILSDLSEEISPSEQLRFLSKLEIQFAEERSQ